MDDSSWKCAGRITLWTVFTKYLASPKSWGGMGVSTTLFATFGKIQPKMSWSFQLLFNVFHLNIRFSKVCAVGSLSWWDFHILGNFFFCKFHNKDRKMFYIFLCLKRQRSYSFYASKYHQGNLSKAAFEIQVLSTLAIKCRGGFKMFQFTWGIRQQKHCQRLSRNHCILRWQWLSHTLPFCKGLWFGF